MVGVYIENKIFNKQIKYVFTVISEVLGLEFHYYKEPSESNKECELNIAYLEDCNSLNSVNSMEKKIIIFNSKQLFSDNYLKKESIPEKVKRFKLKQAVKHKEDLISICNPEEELFIKSQDNSIITNVDIISDMFFMLSRYEEIVFSEKANKEIYNRFPARESVAFNNNFLHRPVVNEYIEFLWIQMKNFQPAMERLEGWNGKRFAGCLTHDVDFIEKHSSIKSAIKSFARLMLKDKKIGLAFQDFIRFIKSRSNYKMDAYWTFDYIIELEKKYGFNSTFYFMTGGESQFDNKYNYKDKRVTDLINKLNNDNFECGYHGSFNTYNKFELLEQEKKRLDEIIIKPEYGIRQHFLRLQMPLTLELQERLGFIYDCSLGFADKEGFRSGICFPYKPYDLIEDRILEMWEIPLVVMETSIIDKKYNSYSMETAKEKIRSLVDEAENYGGVFTLLWHNSSLDNYYPVTRGWDKVYEDVMSYLHERDCYGSNGRDIIKIYTTRGIKNE